MKWWAIAFLLLIPILATAQNYEDQWTGHFSYVSVKDISQGDNTIFVGAENAVFTYNLNTQELKTISSINGLSGNSISTIHYSDDFDLLVIGYENGLIEIVKKDDQNVLKVVDIVEKQSIPPNKKRINNIREHNGQLYLSTQYGVSVYDLSRLEFGDTYFIGDLGTQIDIVQTTIQEPYIYAASSTDGIKRALVDNDDLIDYRQWTTIVGGGFKAIETLGSSIYAANASNAVLKVTPQGGTTTVRNFSTSIQSFRKADNLLTITTSNSVQAFSDGFIEEAMVNNVIDFDLKLQSGLVFGNNVYLGTTEDGLLIVPIGSNQATQVLPNGPIRNRPFALDASENQLWVTFGDVTVHFNPYPLSRYGVSQLKDSVWINTSYEELSTAVNGEPTDLINVTINPQDPNEVFMSSFQFGLLKMIEGAPSILYNENNSPLDKAILNGSDAGIRIYGSDYDRQGNLWFVQSRTDDALVKLSSGGQFQKIDISSIIDPVSDFAMTKLVVDRANNIFFGTYSSGMVGYNPSTNKFNKIGEGTGSGNLPNLSVRALALDSQNRLWIGTLKGLRVLYSPGSFFDEGSIPQSQAIIILENGVPQELLYEQSITDIEVDGSNNKWISTATSGVFYLSPNGQETLLRFNKDNSPLPTNNVQDIAIDPNSGVVYFATSQGLLAYKGSATAPSENLDKLRAFPNPVRPGFNGNVTIDGLTAGANVKITDINGSLVFEQTSEGGSILWDTTAFGKYKVRSGVYFVLVTTDDYAETKVSKIMIIR
ncbi:type IX secretion system anionic LPS delivery protein PorZ [Aequorivita sinensis]|uniref:type IX secretion system anionic LPS delivery protein PorZ n=1 Tax=Aequorivita sinensis TaxID=1382458 RepID=UPI0011225BE3|nr:T9SS type A sorting domain-containing protein [Aequorivita sinensis]